MLEISEIYKSIQGESQYWGYPCVIVRFANCNLECVYCDTAYAKESGTKIEPDKLLKKIISFNIPLVCITGGEPLLQKEVFELTENLLNANLTVLLETNGTIDISPLDFRTVIIMDIKCPSSGMSNKTMWENLDWLSPEDGVKFVLKDKEDFNWALNVIKENNLDTKVNVLLSPVHDVLSPDLLSKWMLEEKINARLNLQLHKYIWQDAKHR